MKLVAKLLDYIHRGFDKEPESFVALRLRHSSAGFRWTVSDRVLSGFDGATLLFQVDLSAHTLASLISHLYTYSGVEVAYAAGQDRLGLSACVLLDGEGAQAESNGDVLLGYSSLLWVYLDAVSTELVEAKARVVAMLDQMSIKTADTEWLDEWGGYFGVPRLHGEVDADYANRIVVEVMRPRENNKAIEIALLQNFGQESSVVDVRLWGPTSPLYNANYTHNSAVLHNASPVPVYGLFDVVIGYDLLSGADQQEYANTVRSFIERFRAAGTHMRSLSLSGSVIEDVFAGATDGGDNQPVAVTATSIDEAFSAPTDVFAAMDGAIAAFTESFSAPADGTANYTVSYTTSYNGLRSYNGAVPHSSGGGIAESI